MSTTAAAKHTTQVIELELTPAQVEQRRINTIARHLRAMFPRLQKKRARVDDSEDPRAPDPTDAAAEIEQQMQQFTLNKD